MGEDSEISEGDQECFKRKVYHPYIQGVINHISSRMNTSIIFSACSLFDPCHLHCSEGGLQVYGKDNLQALITFYGSEQRVVFEDKTCISTPNIDRQGTELEWKIFWCVLFSQFRSPSLPESSDSSTSNLHKVTSHLLTDSTLNAASPNLAILASLQLVLPVTTATVECIASVI